MDEPELFHGLSELCENYTNILLSIKDISSGDISIGRMKIVLEGLRFGNDPDNQSKYVHKRLGQDDFLSDNVVSI